MKPNLQILIEAEGSLLVDVFYHPQGLFTGNFETKKFVET